MVQIIERLGFFYDLIFTVYTKIAVETIDT